MHVIATAGHVDHGKSALVAALSGINPDRLVEEQKREMTIDLGFAWLTLPNGEELSIIDVPGHKDFIENMLAGVGGIDAVLLIIAADEGIMPQTREHLNIINLLDKKTGIIVLTKVDLINDPDWLSFVETDLRNSLANSALANAPIVKVSSKTGEGIENLKLQIADLLDVTPLKKDIGKPRLPIDRVFLLPGFGTIVTGTLLDGSLKTGESVLIQPSGISCRIRGLQTHKRKESVAQPGNRTAVNLTGINVDQVSRGDVLTLPNLYQPTRRVDVHIRLIEEAGACLNHDDMVKVFIAASERIARVRVLGTRSLKPGESGWLQIETVQPLIVEKGDRFIIRRMSPAETLGGGIILDAHPGKRYKLNDTGILDRLESMLRNSPEDLILNLTMDGEPTLIREIIHKAGVNDPEGLKVINQLILAKKLFLLLGVQENLKGSDIVIRFQGWEKITQKNQRILQDFHARFPLRIGVPLEEWKSKLGIPGESATLLMQKLEETGIIALQQNRIRLATHAVCYTISQEKKIALLWELFEKDRYNPPSIEKCKDTIGEDLFDSLVETGVIVRISEEIVFRAKEYAEMIEYVITIIKNEGILMLAKFRDHFQTSRKYSLAFLEHLDRRGVTHRDGEGRVLNG
ncbi:MAG: selenocysteine-specific elongation factor [Chloroflexi bacterium]|nr:MAG: selenocysteine-specific elongation factor [Chloroflexota bacterium]